MAFVTYEDLNHYNSSIYKIRLVKSMAKRPKEANFASIYEYSDPIFEVLLHTYQSLRQQKRGEKRQESWHPWCCDDGHARIFIHEERLYYRSKKSGFKEFKNPWLLDNVMKAIFRERK